MRDIDVFYLQKEEPVKSCLQALREIILYFDEHISESWKYGMPFFCYKEKRICYLWINKKTNQPYLGVVDGNKISHAALISENRSRMKIMIFDAKKDLPLKSIKVILKLAIEIQNKKQK